jgi:F-type H+-transporting ATPase subunit delta
VSVSIVARRYAQALLDLGSELGSLDAIVDEIGAAADAWEVSADFRNAIENPLVAHDAKKAVVVDLAERIGASATTRSTLLLLVDRRRMKTLPYIARTLRELGDARKGVVRAEVTTAAPLSDAYYAKLQAKLEKMTGARIVLDKKIDPDLIGGVIARIGDRIFDGSLRTRLQTMRSALLPN